MQQYWKIIFQVSNTRDRNLLNLLDNDLYLLKLLYIKGDLQIKYFGHLNSLCARATKAIINHTPIGEYHLSFFSLIKTSVMCSDYPIELRHHILHDYRRFNNYWNLRRDIISHFVFFLELNSNYFSFGESITQFCRFCLLCSSYIFIWFSSFLFPLIVCSYITQLQSSYHSLFMHFM